MADLKMDRVALAEFLRRDFPEMADEFSVERVEADSLTLRLIVQPKHLRPGGTVSGPALFGLADVALYLAILSRIGPMALTVTTNAAMDFLRKPQAGCDLLAKTRILKMGRSLVVGDALIYSEGMDDPVARAGMTYSVPPNRG